MPRRWGARPRRWPLLVSLVMVLLCVIGCQSGGASTSPSSTSTEWHPKHRYVAPQLTPDEMAARRLWWLKGLADADKLHPATTPALVRYVMLEETGPTQEACMRAAGWRVTAHADGNGITADESIPDSQMPAFAMAHWVCQAQYSLHPRLIQTSGQFPPELLRMGWEYNHDVVIPCLARHGLSVTKPLPSMETYVAQNGLWLGYPDVPDDRAVAVGKECPQQMPSRYLLGDG